MNPDQLKKSLDYYSANPTDPRANEFNRRLKTGTYDDSLKSIGMARKQDGIYAVAPEKEKQGIVKETAKDIGGFISDTRESSQAAADKMAVSQEAYNKGEQNLAETVLQKTGALAGSGAAAIGNLFTAAAKAVVPQSIEEDFSRGLGVWAQRIGNVEAVKQVTDRATEIYNTLPENQKRNIDAAGGIAALASEFVGASAAKQPISEGASATARGIKQAAESTASGVSKAATGLVDASAGTARALKSTATFAKDLVTDVVPTKQSLADRALARSLKLAPVEDVARIENIAGEPIAQFMKRNDVIKGNVQDTLDSLAKVGRNDYETVRDYVTLVDDTYTFDDIPAMKDTVEFLKQDLAGKKSAEYKNAYEKLKQLSEADNFNLNDVQFTKSLFDDIESVYKRSGEVKDAISAQDKASVANELRRFVEDRVSEAYPEVDIRELNRTVRVARELQDAITRRSGKVDTQSFASLGDFFVLGIPSNPLQGAALLGAKKVAESPAIGLRVANKLSGSGKGITQKTRKELSEKAMKELESSFK